MLPVGLDTAAFLREHWQKKPLLLRGAFPGFDSPLDGDELAGLACEPGIESRIVVTEPGPRYVLRNGPFTDTDFAPLGARDWTLLVQDIDKHLPDLAAFLDHFAFIPSWRIDDLMVSWAADGGSVGPHVDQYDVFLLQAQGRRRWRIGAPGKHTRLLPDHDIGVLADFVTTEEWVLDPGDMLYLPPGVPHWGTAEGSCMTWSIGFRAPSAAELLADFADRLGEVLVDTDRYADPDLAPSEADGGRLSPRAVERARALLEAAVAGGAPSFARWFGELVTAPKAWLHPDPAADAASPDDFAARVRSGTPLMRDPRAHLAWMESGKDLLLFVDGRSIEVPRTLENLLRTLCSTREFPSTTLARYLGDREALGLLAGLYAGGQLVDTNND